MVVVTTLLASMPATARQSQTLPPHSKHRCATMEAQQRILQTHPDLPAKWAAEGKKQQLAWQQRTRERQLVPEGSGNILSGEQEIIIPVVFHLVGSSTILNTIPDRDIYDQLAILNRDFAGDKAASYHGLFAAELATRIGRVPVKFVLARRTPSDAPSTGIQRRVTTQTFSAGGQNTPITIDQLKSTASGGLDAWDPSRYLNVWCATFTDGSLGIATFPHSDAAELGPQGVAIDLYTLGANPCRVYFATYNEGATLSHEIGHYFYLYHTFGDLSFCNNTDFKIENGWPLTPAASQDDTPPEKGGSNFIYGNISGIYSDGCSNTGYGMMYQNFMNYFDDRALYMFSASQKERIMATLDIYRSGLLNSNGATPPAAVTDAWLVSCTPMGNCDTKAPVINQVPVSVTVRNYGSTNLTSISVTIQLDGLLPTTTNFPLTLPPGADTILAAGSINGTMGDHTLRIYTAAPNGSTDQYRHNDTLTSYINIRTNTITTPFKESFNSNIFPPRFTSNNDGWLLSNPQNQAWVYNSTAGATAAGSASFPNNNIANYGEIDELISPPIDPGINDSAVLTFKVAHAQKNNITSDWDGLEIYISGDGGQRYTLAYKKVSNQLKTIASNSFSPFNPGTDPLKWRSDTVNLTPFIIPGQKMFIRFRNVNAGGNNTYLDDINVTATHLPARDLVAITIKGLPPFICANNTLTPSFSFSNSGATPVTSLNIHYQLDHGPVTILAWSGSLSKGQQATQTLPSISNLGTGSHILTVYTSAPNGQPDQQLSNDTIRTGIHVLAAVNSPIHEGFEANSFPPAGWGILSSGHAFTWERTTTASLERTAAAWIRNYRFNSNSGPDLLYSSPMKVGEVDSVLLRFHLAHATELMPGDNSRPTDTLEVLISTDCGLTMQSVYKKWGVALETTGNPDNPIAFNRSTNLLGFVPLPSQWRRETIDLSQLVANHSMVQVFFRNTSKNDNNTYLDNISLNTVLVPEQLRNNGYLMAPNPFRGWFYIRHLQPPADLKQVMVVNAGGQIVYRQSYNGNAGNYLRVDLRNQSDGLYIVKMVYHNKVVTEKLVNIR